MTTVKKSVTPSPPEAVIDLVDLWQARMGSELEAVITFHKRHSVPFSVFEQLHTLLSKLSKTNPKLLELPVAHYIDSFYHDNIRSRHTLGQRVEVIQKTRIANLYLKATTRANVSIRLNLKNETPIEEKHVHGQVPLLVRCQEVYNFQYGERFEYSLRKVVSGATKEAACQNKPTYHLELEVIRLKKTREPSDIGQLSSNFLSKIGDLLGRSSSDEVFVFDVIPNSTTYKRKSAKKRKTTTSPASSSSSSSSSSASAPSKTKTKSKSKSKSPTAARAQAKANASVLATPKKNS